MTTLSGLRNVINPADWQYILIGSGLAFATQGTLIMGRDTLPLPRIVVSSSLMAALAAFSVNGLLILGFGVPPLASMFLGGLVGFLGGDFALKKMSQALLQRYGGDGSLEDLKQTLIDVKATMTDMQTQEKND